MKRNINSKLFKARRLARRYYNNKNCPYCLLPDESDKVVQLYMLFSNHDLSEYIKTQTDAPAQVEWVDRNLEYSMQAEAKHAEFKIRKNQFGEYVVRLYVCGLLRKDSDYFANDMEDAVLTGLHMASHAYTLGEESAEGKGQTARLCKEPLEKNPFNQHDEPLRYAAWQRGWEKEDVLAKQTAAKKEGKTAIELKSSINNLLFVYERALKQKQLHVGSTTIAFFSETSGEYVVYVWVEEMLKALRAEDHFTALGHLAQQFAGC